MRSIRITVLTIAAALVFMNTAMGQSPDDRLVFTDSGGVKRVTMAAGIQFAASPSKQFWWGKHWRDEWLTPVSFPVLRMDTTAGGLTPLKAGGGHQTKTLRVLGKDGREYVLRTIDKSLDILIPALFKKSFIEDIVNDQISTAHPYGPLAVADLSGSAGLMHTNPVIVFVPDDSRLGEFRETFANKLCLFEERTSGDGWEHTAVTRNADDIVNTEKLEEKLLKDNDKKVDQEEFLKARLFDMLINDWDRHEDQWVWTGNDKGDRRTYQAFARDRDQSFSKTDGVSLFFISLPWALRSVQNMSPNLRDVRGSNLSAIVLDKKFTNELTREHWQSTIQSVQQSLTDSAISHALHEMPDPIYAHSGDFLYKRLRQRRDNMMDYGMKYYRIINKQVAITGSDKKELFTINKIDHSTTEVTVQALSKKEAAGDTIFHRVFTRGTKIINLYGMDGDDQFVYTGKAKNKILVRTFGNEGSDVFSDSLDEQRSKKIRVYDMPADKPAASNAFRYRAITDTSITNYHKKWYKYDWWMPLIYPSYNPDDGVFIGAGYTYRRQGWNKDPYKWQQTIGGTYAASTGAFSLYYKGLFKQVFGQWDVDIAANYKAPTYVINFYGFGNETELLTKKKKFYRIRATSFLLNPAISRTWQHNTFRAGPVFNTIKVQAAENKFFTPDIPGIDSSVLRAKNFGGASAAYTLNTANDIKYPTRGINYYATASYLWNLKENKRSFANLETNFTFYFTPVKRITLAHRSGVSTNIGEYEFYQANTLGGNENLRGYWRSRFTGRSSFYQNTDIRWKIADLKGYVLRGALGIYGFFDDGRVWVKDDESDLIHTGYGGGIYFVPYRILAINLSYAVSKEVKVFMIRAGFLF